MKQRTQTLRITNQCSEPHPPDSRGHEDALSGPGSHAPPLPGLSTTYLFLRMGCRPSTLPRVTHTTRTREPTKERSQRRRCQVRVGPGGSRTTFKARGRTLVTSLGEQTLLQLLPGDHATSTRARITRPTPGVEAGLSSNENTPTHEAGEFRRTERECGEATSGSADPTGP